MRTAGGRRHEGPAGTAVEVLRTQDPDDLIGWSSTVASWLLTCPGQSPAWDHYLLAVAHLRDLEGASPVIRVPHATHEVVLIALDRDSLPKVDDPLSWKHLMPPNVCEQLTLPGDTDAAVLLERCALAIVHGRLPAEPPLAGAVEPWRSSLLQTAAHHRGEVHGWGAPT